MTARATDIAGPLLLEMDMNVSFEQLQRALASHGLALMTNPLTKRQRVTAIPPYLQADHVAQRHAAARVSDFSAKQRRRQR